MSPPGERSSPQVTTPEGHSRSLHHDAEADISLADSSYTCLLCLRRPVMAHTWECCAQCHDDLVAGFHRRAQAKLRLPPLEAA